MNTLVTIATTAGMQVVGAEVLRGGLAVTPDLFDVESLPNLPDRWTYHVTHLASGHSIFPVADAAPYSRASAAMQALLRIADWTLMKGALEKRARDDPRFLKGIKAARQRMLGQESPMDRKATP